MSVIPSIVMHMVVKYVQKQRDKVKVRKGECPRCGQTTGLEDVYGWEQCLSCGWEDK
jgi:ribosomal protein S27AE